MIRVEINDQTHDTFSTQFSGGELHVSLQALQSEKLRSQVHPAHCRVMLRIQDHRDVMELVLLTELLRRELPAGSILTLVIPYFPYARQDRVTEQITSFSLKAFAKLINSLGYDHVLVYDPHSDVTPALIENCLVVQQHVIVTSFYPGLNDYIMSDSNIVIVAPDAGAAKKAEKIAKFYGRPLLVAEKIRNVTTGEITGVKCEGATRYTKFLMVDDICDGGRTFTELGKVLRNGRRNAEVILYVTHGIFSKGFEPFTGIIDRIYTTDTFLGQKPLPSEEGPPLFIGKVCPAQLAVRA